MELYGIKFTLSNSWVLVTGYVDVVYISNANNLFWGYPSEGSIPWLQSAYINHLHHLYLLENGGLPRHMVNAALSKTMAVCA